MFSTLARWIGFSGPLSPRRIEKSGKLAANPFAQPDVRMREMQRLLKDGSEAALSSLLQRFSVNAQGHIADEEEKRWLCDALIERGKPVVEPVRQYIRAENRLTHALETYTKVCGAQEAAQFFVDVLQSIGPRDHRRQEAKLQLVLALGDYIEHASVQAALSHHLHDHSDDVRVSVLDVLDRALTDKHVTPSTKEAVLQPIQALASDSATSRRVAQRAEDLQKKHGMGAAG